MEENKKQHAPKLHKAYRPIRHRGTQFVLNRNMRPGALVGIDSIYYNVAYPISVVVYELLEIEEPGEMLLMRTPGNCVANLVRST